MFKHTGGRGSNTRYDKVNPFGSKVRTGWLTDANVWSEGVQIFHNMRIEVYALPVIQEFSWDGLLYEMHCLNIWDLIWGLLQSIERAGICSSF